jgi:predicted dehydrogenase
VLVRTCASLVSAGTERSAAAFAGSSLAQKALRRPDLVRQVVDKIRRDGLWEAQHAVRSRLEAAEPLGYSCSGTVAEDGTGEHDVGSLVACAGGGHAAHAEYNLVPRNLVVPVPPGVSSEWAAFATVGSVALHGVRLTRATLGEFVVVIGLGLIGQLAVQLLKAAGCTVVGYDPQPARAALALELGCDQAASDVSAFSRAATSLTRERGADAVLIAAATKDSSPVALATQVARGRARVVVVGDTGLELDRRAFYEKELQLVVPRSYGPGRYDREYEERGLDYPYEYVRWTEQRNLEAFLDLAPRLHLDPLISHRFTIDAAAKAYELLLGQAQEPYLGIVLTYPQAENGSAVARRIESTNGRLETTASLGDSRAVGVSVVGGGNYARATLLPALGRVRGVRRLSLVTAKGLRARDGSRRFGFESCSTDVEDALTAETDLLVVATPHSHHAHMVRDGLSRHKALFVEKPLCVSEAELAEISTLYKRNGASPFLMVGYNRRFAPLVVRLREWLDGAQGPFILNYRVNAGRLAAGSWLLDPEEGGGRIVGEACHFVDLMLYLIGALPRQVYAARPTTAGRTVDAETMVTVLEFEGGSVGTLAYSTAGDPSVAKERLEIVGAGAVAVLDDFRSLTITQEGRTRRFRTWRRDKGHVGELQATVDALRSGASAPIPFHEIEAGMQATFLIGKSLACGRPITL